MKTEIRKITKEVAEVLLSENIGNRKISRVNVDFLKDQILKGKFEQNGDTIRISKSGRLLDGQHRLMAIKETGVALDLLVVYGLNDEVFSTIDTGRNRTAGDVLSAGSTGGNQDIAAGIRLIINVFNEKRKIVSSGDMKISNGEILEFYNKHKQRLDLIYDRLSILKAKDKIKVISKAQSLALVYLLEEINYEFAFSFVRELITGHQDSNGNLVIKIREHLIAQRLRKVSITPLLIASIVSQYFLRYCKKESNESFLRLNGTSTLSDILKSAKLNQSL